LVPRRSCLWGADATRRFEEIDALFESFVFPVLVLEDLESTSLNGLINGIASAVPTDREMVQPCIKA